MRPEDVSTCSGTEEAGIPGLSLEPPLSGVEGSSSWSLCVLRVGMRRQELGECVMNL